MLTSTKFFAPPDVGFRNLFKFLFMASAMILLITSCNQDDSKSMITNPDSEYAMYYKILTFLETKEGKPLTQPTVTPRTTYSPGDILDYVEGGMNLQYTDPRPTWTSYDVRTDTFTIPLTSGYASQQDLEDLFDEVRDTASVHFYGITEPDKFPFLYDATNVSSNATVMNISVTARVGKVYRELEPFGSTDYWNISQGKCGPFSGGTDDAQDVMNDALNEYYAPYACVFYTNVTYVHSQMETYGWSDTNQNDPIEGDFSIDYKTFIVFCIEEELDPQDPCFIEGLPDCNELDFEEIECLDPDELNYYFGSIVGMYNSYFFNTGLNHISSSIYLEFGLCEIISKFWAPSSHFGKQNSCLSEEFPTYLPQCC